jgi:predicted nucleotidyltransferase
MDSRLVRLLNALKEYQPRRVLLFGSAARGEADAQSDLDLLVIKETTEPFVARLEMMAHLCPPDVHADILVYTPKELERMAAEGNPFITQALSHGKVIYEAGP